MKEYHDELEDKKTELRKLFINCWTHAHASPDYNKKEWMRLQQLLWEFRIHV